MSGIRQFAAPVALGAASPSPAWLEKFSGEGGYFVSGALFRPLRCQLCVNAALQPAADAQRVAGVVIDEDESLRRAVGAAALDGQPAGTGDLAETIVVQLLLERVLHDRVEVAGLFRRGAGKGGRR